MALTEYVMDRTTFVDDDGSGTTGTILDNAALQAIYQQIDDRMAGVGRGLLTGRIYPVSAQPSWAGNVASYTTIYFGPAATPTGAAFAPGLISLYNGSKWILYTFTEISLSLAGLTNGSTYDLFVYNSGGTLTLEAVVWAGSATPSSTTRQDGIEVKTGAASKRFVGCIHINGGTGTLTVNASTNPIWNAYNQLQHCLRAVEASANWTYAVDAFRPWNNNTANRISTLHGRAVATGSTVAAPIDVRCTSLIDAVASEQQSVSIGLNSTSAAHASAFNIDCIAGNNAAYQNFEASLTINPPLGYNYFQMLERANVGTVGFGSGGTNGITAVISC